MRILKFLAFGAVLSLLSGQIHSMEQSAQHSLIHDIKTVPFDSDRDISDIYRICESNWEHIYIGKPYDPKIVDYLMAQGNESKQTHVLRYQDSTIGFINCYINKEKGSFYLDTGAIASEYQKNGLGKYFFPKVIELAQNMKLKKVTIDVKKDNEIMLALCKSHGFIITDDKVLRGQAYELERIL
jgi:ribosomal protein S18 acetylase RimI-like enzyme